MVLGVHVIEIRAGRPVLIAAAPAVDLSFGAGAGTTGEKPHEDLGEAGAELSNPVAGLRALFAELDFSFFEDDVQTGDGKSGTAMLFPLHGADWKPTTGSTVPIVWPHPIPDGFDTTDRDPGIGDISTSPGDILGGCSGSGRVVIEQAG